jgi:hypothetical protein
MAELGEPFDSYRYLDPATRKIMKAWTAREPVRPVPWTPLAKPLAEATIALVSSAAVALKGDRPFDQEGERRNPWWGDPSHRVIPREATTEETTLYHLHIDTSHGERDLDCVLPLARLRELEAAGEVGRSAPSHYSFMGFILKERELLEKTVPLIVERMKAEAVDAAALVPV